MKRLFDVVASALGLCVTWPLILAAAVLVKLEDGGPALLRQWRVGRNFRLFEMLKLRTMVPGAPEIGPGVTIDGDVRVTRIGALLRRAKIDELPQLFNVLLGQMSLVGPRPELERYVDLYPEEYHEVLQVRPGITDLASIVYREESEILGRASDPEAHYIEVVLPDKIRMAREYVRHSSVLYDLRLIFTTLSCLIYPQARVERAIDLLGRFRRVRKTAHSKVSIAFDGVAGIAGREERKRLLAVLEERIRSVSTADAQRTKAQREGSRS